MMRSRTAIALLAAVLLSLGLGACSERQETPAASSENARIFAATLPDLEGKPQPLKQWQGKVLVLNFWAAWCPPCRAETPGFIQLQEKYRAKGVVFVGIALDQKDNVQAFVDEMGVNYPILLGESDAIELSRAAGNRLGGLPFTAVFAKDGAIVNTVTGEYEAEALENTLNSLL
jgi:thiol-disulfide isomerase/thioredoxin